MKHYSQVSIEAQSKVASLRQEARQQQHLASSPSTASRKTVGIVSAISISVILLVAFGFTTNQSITITATQLEFQLSTTPQELLPMAQSFNVVPEFLEADTSDNRQFMAQNLTPENMLKLVATQSPTAEIVQF